MSGFPLSIVEAAFGRPAPTFERSDAGLLAALQALGDSIADVHDRLTEGGHRGQRGCDGTCPIAAYLADLFPGLTPSVDFDTVELVDANGQLAAYADMPPPVAELRAVFDLGGMPALDADIPEEQL